jgi:hypothetical protein
MADAPKYTDEYLDRFFSGIMSLVPREPEYPPWFACADILAKNEEGYARAIDAKFTAHIKASYAELRLVLDNVRTGLDEGVGPLAEKCLRDYVENCLDKTDESVGGQQDMVNFWRNKLAEGVQRGPHHKFKVELAKHPEWLKRRPNGKGWVTPYKDIVKALPRKFPVPVASTVHRIRTSALKKKSEPQ